MFKVVKIFEDPTKGIINLRLIRHLTSLAEYTELSEVERKEFFDLLVLIGKKLAAVWTHLEDYKSQEDTIIAKVKENPITPGQKIAQFEPSQELFFEFDEFLVQVKSCLDYLVKIPAVILGRKAWTLRTFGDKGDDVIKALRNNVPSQYKKMSEVAISFIEKNRPWLEDTIAARDKINHFIDGGINFEYFTVSCLKENDKEIFRLPMWSPDQSIRNFIEVVWNNLFKLCEDFIGSILYFQIKKGYAFYHGTSSIGSIESPWKATSHEEYKRITAMPGWSRVE